jgi:hypothetical protein
MLKDVEESRSICKSADRTIELEAGGTFGEHWLSNLSRKDWT